MSSSKIVSVAMYNPKTGERVETYLLNSYPLMEQGWIKLDNLEVRVCDFCYGTGIDAGEVCEACGGEGQDNQSP